MLGTCAPAIPLDKVISVDKNSIIFRLYQKELFLVQACSVPLITVSRSYLTTVYFKIVQKNEKELSFVSSTDFNLS